MIMTKALFFHNNNKFTTLYIYIKFITGKENKYIDFIFGMCEG